MLQRRGCAICCRSLHRKGLPPRIPQPTRPCARSGSGSQRPRGRCGLPIPPQYHGHKLHQSAAASAAAVEPSTVSASGNVAKPVTEAQRRSARLELENMTRSTSRLLAMSFDPSSGDECAGASDAVVNEARAAMHYWSRRWYMHFHPGFGRAAKGSALAVMRRWDDGGERQLQPSGDGEAVSPQPGDDGNGIPTTQNAGGNRGARQSELLLDWCLSNDLVRRGVFASSNLDVGRHQDASSPNLILANIIETYLLPTAYGGGDVALPSASSVNNNGNFATLIKHYTINGSYVQAVVDATRVMRKMKWLHADHPEFITPDSLSVKAELSVWSKRAIILGGDGPIDSTCMGTRKEMLLELEQQQRRQHQGHDSALSTAIWEKVFDDDIKDRVEECLKRMESIISEAENRCNSSTNDSSIRPSVDWYNHLLGALARSGLEGSLEKSKRILRGMEMHDDGNNGNERVDDARTCHAGPDVISYNSVLLCLARDPSKNKAEEATALLQAMKDRYARTRDDNLRPNEVTYGAVLHVLAQVGMADEAERILDSLEDDGGSGIVPSLTIYNSVLNAIANSYMPSAPRRADALLERMRHLASSGKNPNATPDPITISTVISCHARSKTRRGAERGEEILDEALAAYSRGDARMKPDAIMFNCAITGWANISGLEKKKEEDVCVNDIPAERAELLLRKMKDCHLLEIQPLVYTFNIILDCWAKSGLKGSSERALHLMRRMPSYGVEPDEISYNSVLHAMTKEEDPKWVNTAEDIFQEMKDKISTTDIITYHVMMNIHGKSSTSDGASKTEELLRNMNAENLRPTSTSYNICIDAYARRGDHRNAERLLEEMISLSDQGNVECRPSIHSFASVVNALAKSGDRDAPARAKEIVRKVEETDYISPNSILYNSLIDCIVRSRQRHNASDAEGILLKMEQMHRAGNADVRPNSYAYSMVMTCCARSTDAGAGERAERILMSMESLYEEGNSDVVANSRCYSAAMTAWARHGGSHAVERTFALLDRIEENGRTGSPHAKPNSHCYNACIAAIAKSQESGKAKLCREVLQRMIAAKDDGFHAAAPTLVTYSTILNACAFTQRGESEEDKKDTFDLARTCFLTLLESPGDMDELLFANFFRVISHHLKPGPIRDQFAEAVFLEGCKLGKIGKQVLTNFQRASPSVSDRVLSQHGESLPIEWQSNTRTMA